MCELNLVVERLKGIRMALGDDLFDRAVAMGNEGRNVEAPKRTREDDLEDLFDRQIIRLASLGFHPEIVERLRIKKKDVLARAKVGNFSWEHFPFLPVIPRDFCAIHSLAEKLGHRERLDFAPSAISDCVEVPRDPYFVFDADFSFEVREYSAPRERNPLHRSGGEKTVANIFSQQGRGPLTLQEVLSSLLFCEKHTDLMCLGSTAYQEWIPFVESEPLRFRRVQYGWSHDYRIPSCGGRA